MDYRIIYDGEEEVCETTEVEDLLNKIRVFAENMKLNDYKAVVVTLNAEY